MAEATQTSSISSSACPTPPPENEAPPLFQNGVLTFQAHHVGWIVSSFFAIIATAVSIWLIIKHLTWYNNKKQQRQIVRLLLMVPIYSIISCLAYFFWNHAIPLSLIRDAYEGIILAAFFYLLLQYLAPTPAEQKEYFRHFQLKKWAWPFGGVKRKPDGLYFLQLMKWSILQYCWIRPLTSFAAVIMNMIGIYCEQSWSPRFGSVWILIIVSVAVSVAMFCLIQFYLSISDKIKQYKPILQLFSIKAIIFLMFWQSTFLSALHSFNVIKDTKYMNAEDINTGIAAILQTFEMVLFAFLHVKCFSYLPYRKADRNLMTKKGEALKHALDFRDFWRETRDGVVYMWRKMRGKEAELEARRRTHFERAMGKTRNVTEAKKELPPEPHTGVRSDDDSDDDLDIPQSRLLLEARQHPWMAERKSFEKVRGSKVDSKPPVLPLYLDPDMAPGHERQRSWWSRMYGRLSNGGSDEAPSAPSGQRSQQSGGTPSNLPSKSKDPIREYARGPVDLDEPPPASLLGRGHKRGGKPIDPATSGEKQPFLDWNPSITLAPRMSEKGMRSDVAQAMMDDALVINERGSQGATVERKDSLFGRIFTHTPEHSHDEQTEEAHKGMPSLFQKKHDIAGAVKGWNLPFTKAPPLLPNPPPAASKLLPSTLPTTQEDDMPSIPSLSPSPRGGRPPSQQILDVVARGSPPAPVQPMPVLHQSLSKKPALLIADERGILPLAEVKPSQPRDRTKKWVETTNSQISVSPPSLRQTFPTQPAMLMAPLTGSYGVNGDSFAMKGPRRPAKLVMPTPLSPARYPGGRQPQQPLMASVQPGTIIPRQPPLHQYSLPPGAGYGQRPPTFNGAPDSYPSNQPYGPPPGISRSRGAMESPAVYSFNPYEQFGAMPTVPPPQGSKRRSRERRREHRQRSPQDAESPRRSQSRSPFGINTTSSDNESLPRHPALRQHTARQRRKSQPLPDLPPQASSKSKRRSEPPQGSALYNADMSSSPTASAANLLNPSTPGTPNSPLGDSRYPRATSRENYFDPYDTVAPYLTSIMTDKVPPSPALGGVPSPISPTSPTGPNSLARRTKRR